MKKTASIISLIVFLVYCVGCTTVSTPTITPSAGIIPVTSGSQVELHAGSGENVIRPINPSFSSLISVIIGPGSGENVVRPQDLTFSSQSVVSTSGVNVVPPQGTKGDDSLPAAMSDYTSAQRERLQITDPLEPLDLSPSQTEYNRSESERFQITDPMP